MPEITEQELKKQIKDRNFASLYLIYGNEAYLKSHYAGRICALSVDDALRDFNFHRFEGKNVDFDSLYEAIEAFPMMSARTCVLLKDIPFDLLNTSDQERLCAILKDIPQTCTVVLWMDTIQIDARKNAKWRAFLKEMQPYAQIVPLDKRSRSDLIRILRNGASKRGCTIRPENAEYLISLVGDELMVLLQELEKLCAYKAEGEITSEDVDAVSIRSIDAVVFDLSKAVFRGEGMRAFSILHSLLMQKTDPVMIFGALNSCYVDIYRAKVFQLSGDRPENAAHSFNYKGKEFRLRNAARDGASLSMCDVRQCLEILLQCDKNLKGSGMDAQLLLERCLTELMMVHRSART